MTIMPSAARNADDWFDKFNRFDLETRSSIADALLGRTLQLYICPTERCNFRCAYCYEDFMIGRMSHDVICRLKKFIDRKLRNVDRCQVNWFGGEPLAALKVLMELGDYTFDKCLEYDVAMLEGSMSTNGYFLTTDIMRGLINIKQTYFQISFDGHGSEHDAVRKRADGKGTYDVIWANLMKLAESDLQFHILIRVHVRPGNESSLIVLLENIQSTIGHDDRFTVGLRPLGNLGGPTEGSFDTLTSVEYDAIVDRLREQFGDMLGRSLTDKQPSEQLACGATVCYAAKPNSFLIRSDGRVGKCTVALDKEYNVIGRLGLDGQLEGVTLPVADNRQRKWSVGMYTLDERDLACPYTRGDAFFRC